MVEKCYVGEVSECPHCFESIEVPASPAVNKDKFMEPPGLRRILQEVRDREWEHMRRKLRTSRAQITQLEKDLHAARESAVAVNVAVDVSAEASAENASLRQELAEMNEKLAQSNDKLAQSSEKFAQANQAFTAGRKQHESAIEKLRRDLELAREEVQALQKKHDAPAQALRHATAEVETLRHQVASAADEIAGLKTSLELVKCESAELRDKLTKTESELEVMLIDRTIHAEPAHAADNNSEAPAEGGSANAEPVATAEQENHELESLKAELEKLKKGRAPLVEARDRARAELEILKRQLSARDHDDEHLESSMSELESRIQEVVRAISARRERISVHANATAE